MSSFHLFEDGQLKQEYSKQRCNSSNWSPPASRFETKASTSANMNSRNTLSAADVADTFYAAVRSLCQQPYYHPQQLNCDELLYAINRIWSLHWEFIAKQELPPLETPEDGHVEGNYQSGHYQNQRGNKNQNNFYSNYY